MLPGLGEGYDTNKRDYRDCPVKSELKFEEQFSLFMVMR
jgi:hypothetical protein